MEHNFFDKYAREDGLLQRLPPKLKILITLLSIVVFVSTPLQETQLFIVYYLTILSFVLASKVPLKVILKRLLVVAPFILLAGFSAVYTKKFSTTEYAIIFSKSILSVSTVILLTATTEFPKLLKGLLRLGTPKVIVMVLSFLYRYIFLLHDELMRIQRARAARTIKTNALSNLRQTGTIIGELLIRSYERSERVHSAMLARGFTGEFKD